jgi:hypothetical protein
MSWGKGIVLTIIGFAVFIGTLAAVCVRQEISLVSTDYYQQELDYQQQIERIENTSTLIKLPSISVVNDSLQVDYANFFQVKNGILKLTRASSARHDVSFQVPDNPNTSHLAFPLLNLPRGRYKGSFAWTMDEKEYYIDQAIDL